MEKKWCKLDGQLPKLYCEGGKNCVVVLLLYRDLVGLEGGCLTKKIVLQYKTLYCNLRGLVGRQAMSRYKHCIVTATARMAWVVL